MDGPGPLIDEAPGTVIIQDQNDESNAVLPEPTPTDDPNDPLNWSKPRKTVNFAIASFYTLASFVLLDIGTVVWIQMNAEVGVSWANLNNSFALNLAGLAVGCIFFIPFAIKYGRRPIYILSTAVQFATAIWNARVNSTGELLAVNAVSGLAGAVSEALVQMTIVDVFFVHQRASANAFYNMMVSAGAYLAPVAAGYCATAQGWRWIWWWTTIMLGINLVLFVFFFEESKYIPTFISQPGEATKEVQVDAASPKKGKVQGVALSPSVESGDGFRKKSYRERMAFITRTDNSLMDNVKRPILVLVGFPAVSFTALVWGTFLSWFSVIVTTQSSYLSYAPYEYNSSQIGLFNLPPFIGGIFGAALGGPMNDWYILWRAKRNNGTFEPETRLHLCIPAIFATPLGILIFGVGIAKGWPWWSLALGSGIFGFAFFCTGACALTYVADCYQEIVGDALVGVAFVRNALSMVIVFVLTPWIEATGLLNMFIAVACIATGTMLTSIPMILYGKRMRTWTASRYRKMALLQPGARRI